MKNELFELRKEVFDRTGWLYVSDIGVGYEYTSDYLLEKLQGKKGIAVSRYVDGDWSAHCERPMHGNAKWVDYYEGEADTPLKALLKLVIALDDAGELKSTKDAA